MRIQTGSGRRRCVQNCAFGCKAKLYTIECKHIRQNVVGCAYVFMF